MNRFFLHSYLLAVLMCLAAYNATAQNEKTYEVATVAFYNLENLFDTIVDPDTSKILQDEFTPKGKNMWNSERYWAKIDKMSRVISQLGEELTQTAPMIVGVSEIENSEVLEDLIASPHLKKYNYGIVHYHSPDRRGVDVGLIYRKDFVTIKSSASRELKLADKPNFFTRAQLVVEADLQGESIYVVVNHWPSRRGGEKKSSPLREAAAALSRSIVDSVSAINSNAKVIVMGDLNDDPTNTSVKKVLNTSGDPKNIEPGQMYNPMEAKYKAGNGTGAYNDTWNLFDQLIVTQAFLDKNQKAWWFKEAKIFKDPKLITQDGQYKGYPHRTFSYGNWIDGYSDHFPVYLFLAREKK